MNPRHAGRSRVINQPEPGFFQTRLVRKGPFVAARICHENGVWWAVVNGEVFAKSTDPANAPRVFSLWHSAEFITESEYNHLLKVKAWAEKNQPDHVAANPKKPIDLSKSPSVF